MIDVPATPVPGVNLVGFLRGELGLGEIARKFVRALDLVDLPCAPIAYDRTPSRQGHVLGYDTSTRASYDTNVVCLNADELPRFAGEVGPGFFAQRYSIGMWFWETSLFRAEDRVAFRFLDEVWAPSRYVRDIVEQVADVPVLVAPIPIEAPTRPMLSRDALGLPPGFMFLFVFDFVSAERKNPQAVVEAFNKAFAVGEGPTLVLKAINGRERKPQHLAALQAAIEGRPDIHVIDGYVSAAERDAFVAACDCFVSLHRSEGYGLTMAEAMSHGKPVIATGYSGNLEFMSEENSHLVPYRLAPVPSSWWAHAPGAQWAEPDVDAAAELMRRVWEHPAEARALGEHAREDALRRCSLVRTAEFIEARVSSPRVREVLGFRAAHDPRPAILDVSLALARDPMRSLATTGRGGTARRLLARALWPYLVEERRVNNALVDVLIALQRSVEDAGRTPPSSRKGADDAPRSLSR